MGRINVWRPRVAYHIFPSLVARLPVIGGSDDDPHQQKLLAQIGAVCVGVICVNVLRIIHTGLTFHTTKMNQKWLERKSSTFDKIVAII